MKTLARKMGRVAQQLLGIDTVLDRLDGLQSRIDNGSDSSQLSQLVLMTTYRDRAASGGPLPAFADVEFSAFSQNGEDGILLFLFALLGMGERRAVELCAGDGRECNAANLLINHGWTGLLLDGNPKNVARGRDFYGQHPRTRSLPPRFVNEWITRENVNDLVRSNGFDGEIDLFSLDMDGVDYWIWGALDVIRPRVVVAEIQCIWGPNDAVTVPYRHDFRAEYVQGFGVYSGASLAAFVRLAQRKGYRFVGMQRLGFNAFFVREDVLANRLPAADLETSLDVPFVRWARRELLPLVQQKTWERV